MRMESILDIEHNGLVLLKQSCGVLSWHLQADTSTEMTVFMPPIIVQIHSLQIHVFIVLERVLVSNQ